MLTRSRIVAGAVATTGVLLLGIGIVYLAVACEDLPGILGPVHGDTSPRTPRGLVAILLGLVALAFAITAARRRPPSPPVQS